jgi:hypothetical protein
MALDEGIIAAKVVEGSFTTEKVIEFLRDELVRTQGSLDWECTDISLATIDYTISRPSKCPSTRQCTSPSLRRNN